MVVFVSFILVMAWLVGSCGSAAAEHKSITRSPGKRSNLEVQNMVSTIISC